MAVVSVKTLHDGWSGTFPKGDAPNFNVVYLVEVDDPTDGNMTVVAADGIPVLGSAYRVGNDHRADVLLKSLSTAPIAGTRNLWQVTGTYGSPEKEDDEQGDPTEGKTQKGEDTEDPLLFAVSMAVSTTRVSTDAINGTYLGQYQDGTFHRMRGFNKNHATPPHPQGAVQSNGGKITNGRVITNSVFRPFDPPPQVEYNRTNVKIKWNTFSMPKTFQRFINSVNSMPITLNIKYQWADDHGNLHKSTAAVFVPQYAGRILAMTSTPSVWGNGAGYHDNELEIEIDKLFTWRLDILDRGYAVLNHDKTFPTYGDNSADGTPVTDGDVSDDGFENREPVLLDGKGKKLNIERSNGCFLRYGVYPELDWVLISLNQVDRIGEIR
mgnify:FL=1|tara:strand:- start:3034 stop:4176 length:1143 start_codon:yes stop_codon:yes gene_type:complete